MNPRPWLLTSMIVLAVFCKGGGGDILGPGDGGSSPPPAGDPEPLFYLTLDTPSSIQPIIAGDMDPNVTYKFVQVEVAEVVNPKRYGLVFEVHYQRGADRTHLGSFSLYPPDNPGRFIVATQGRVRSEGAIIVTMTSPDSVNRADPLRVGIRRVRFLE